MKCYSYSEFFETFANKTRIDIIEALMKKPMSVSEICEATKQEQSNISHNLKILADCNFVTFEQQGKQRIYTLNKNTIAPIMKLVDNHVSAHCCNNCKLVHKPKKMEKLVVIR